MRAFYEHASDEQGHGYTVIASTWGGLLYARCLAEHTVQQLSPYQSLGMGASPHFTDEDKITVPGDRVIRLARFP